MSDSICLIVNPAAGRGYGARAVAAARAALAPLGTLEWHATERAGDEARLARAALAEGCDTIFALGGDGTWSKVAAAIAEAGSDCRFVPLAAGRGNDFAKSIGLPASDYGAMARLVAAGRDTRIDLGRVDDIHFLNSAGFGFDAAVCADVARTPWLHGEASYGLASLKNLFGYRGIRASIGIGGANLGAPRDLLLLVVANGPRFGGNFIIAPGATLDDALLDLVTVGPTGAVARLQLFAHAASGTHTSLPGVATVQASTVTLRFDAPPAFQIDGDLYQAAAATVQVRCVPRVLRVPQAEGAKR